MTATDRKSLLMTAKDVCRELFVKYNPRQWRKHEDGISAKIKGRKWICLSESDVSSYEA